MILAYLPEPCKHPLWNEIERLLKPASNGLEMDENELVWIAFEGTTLFAAGTTLLFENGEAHISMCAGHRHRDWIEEADRIVTAWARDCGASKLTMRGRKGWARYFTKLGWKASPGVDWTYEKAL